MSTEAASKSTLPVALVQQALEDLSEAELQARVVEPLLRAAGFEQVRDVSGPHEKGKDVVATKRELGVVHLYAVQLKRTRIDGKAASPNSLAGLMIQLKQAMTEPVFDPATRSPRTPDRLIFITPFVIDRATLDSAMAQHGELARHQVTILDGLQLAEQAALLIPEELTALRQDLGYRLKMAQDLNLIPEAKAFGIHRDLYVDELYVEADYACFGSVRTLLLTLLEDVGGLPRARRTQEEAQEERLRDLGPLGMREKEALWNVARPWSIAQEAVTAVEPEDFPLETFVTLLVFHTAHLAARLERLSEQTLEPEEAQAFCRELATFQETVDRANRLEMLKRRILPADEALVNALQTSLVALTERKSSATFRHLVRMVGTTVVAGPAGAGKTTLLRKLVLQVSRGSSASTPVFLRAIDLHQPTVNGVLDSLREELAHRNHPLTPKALKRLFQEGALFLAVDGLDEAGERLSPLKAALKSLATTYPKVPFFVSCRHTVDMSDWTFAVHVDLHDFTDEQLHRFLANWFPNRPSLASSVEEWFQRAPAMQSIARRPIIAALLCSLFDIGADVPSTESELYASRAELLLGKWEQVKGIPPMRRELRERYLLFLMALAHEVHAEERRTFPLSQMRTHAQHYHRSTERFSVDGFIEDCVSRGLLYAEGKAVYSFGHLTYQEFFAARYLAHHNEVSEIAGLLGQPWWAKTLEFYASLQLDVTPLVKEAARQGLAAAHWSQLDQLLELAPLTDKELFWRAVRTNRRTEEEPAKLQRRRTSLSVRKDSKAR